MNNLINPYRFGGLIPSETLLSHLVALRSTATYETISPNGFADAFFDANGVDAAGSSNEVYNVTSDYYDAPPTTSYGNTNGTGNRTSAITVTLGTGWSGTASLLVNGDTATNGPTPATSDNTGFNIVFDFGSGVKQYITKVKVYKSTASGEGAWKWQGSPDNTNWTDVSTPATQNAATYEYTGLLPPLTEGYRYYRYLGTGGTPAGNFHREFEFEINGTTGALNLDLRSNSYTAASQPSSMNVVMLYAAVDSSTLNTDFIGYVTRDGGTTYTAVTLTDAGASGISGYNYLTGTVDISAQPAGTSMKVQGLVANNKRQKIAGWAGSWV